MAKKPGRLHLDKRAGKIADEAKNQNPDQLLKTREIASWLGVSIGFLEIGRTRGIGPPFVRLAPRMVRYERGAVISWLEERQRLTTAG